MPTTNPTFLKDPDAFKDYSVSWVEFLGTGENIVDSIWLVPSGISLVAGSDSIEGTATVATFSGGVAGRNYAITNRITTDADPARVEDCVILLLVRDAGEAVGLVSLEEFKGFLGPNQTALAGGTYDVMLTNLIESVSREAERYCSRIFRAANYLERVEYEFRGDVVLDQWPIQSVYSMHTFLQSSLDIRNNAANAVRASVRVEQDRSVTLQVVGGASNGSLSIDPSGYADNLNDLRDAINALGFGWSAELSVGRTGYELTEDLMETVAIRVEPNSGRPASLPILGDAADASWELDRESSRVLRHAQIYDYRYQDLSEDWYRFLMPVDQASVRTQRAWVKYRGGYETIEPDLQAVIAGRVMRLSQMDSYNPFLGSEKIGAYEYDNASLSGTQGSSGTVASTVAQDFERALYRWRRIPL